MATMIWRPLGVTLHGAFCGRGAGMAVAPAASAAGSRGPTPVLAAAGCAAGFCALSCHRDLRSPFPTDQEGVRSMHAPHPSPDHLLGLLTGTRMLCSSLCARPLQPTPMHRLCARAAVGEDATQLPALVCPRPGPLTLCRGVGACSSG